MIRRPPRSTQSRSSAASDVYKRQLLYMNKKLQFVLLIVILLFVSLGIYLIFLNINKVSRQQITPIAIVNNFEECVGAGNPVMESYPRQCRSGDRTFVEEIGNVLEKADLINLDNPRPGQIISSPLVISGQGRSGPNCEFTPCSQNSILPYDSGVEGVVTLGPTCPVMRVGDITCNDNPYATTIQIFLSGSAKSSPFTTVNSDKNGAYKVMLPPGEYAFQPVGGSTLPYCETKNITVNAEKITKVDLTCDTGIR